MALKFNTFRAQRYLRSKFVEGRFLLASEASDLELELIDLLRQTVSETLGDVALDEAWEVERLSATELLIKPGEAWFKGLPFIMRSGRDHLVSGASLTLGIVPAGVTVTDDSTGLGKILTFNDGASTPTDTYRLIVTAREELITSDEDEFLKNANLTESTAQKVRLTYKLDIVSASDVDSSPIPYTNDTSDQNLVNEIIVTPTAAGNGELITTTPISGSEGIDGRDLELTIRNNPALGGGNPIPNGTTDQQAFFNGKLIDSTGNEYHINAIFNDTVSTQVIIRIDKEYGQPDPQIINNNPFTLVKRDVYVTDDVNGNFLGKLFYTIAEIEFDTTDGFLHQSSITDLRNKLVKHQEFQSKTNQKFDISLHEGGNIEFDSTAPGTFSWSSDFILINAHGPQMSVASNTVCLLEGSSLVYQLDLAGGAIEKGNLAVTITAAGATTTLSAVDLSTVEIGNIIQVSTEAARITAIDDVNDTIDVTPALTLTGAATIYRDVYAEGTAPITVDSFVLATRQDNKVLLNSGVDVSFSSLPNQISQDRSLKLIEGGTWSVVGTEVFWDSDAFIDVPGVTRESNTIPAGSADLVNANSVAYVTINRTTQGGPTNISVTIADIDAVPLSADIVIIARRVADGILVGTRSFLLKDGEFLELDGALAEINRYFSQLKITPHESIDTRVRVTGSSQTKLNSTVLLQAIEQQMLQSEAVQIDFDSGEIRSEDNLTLIDTFVPAVLGANEYFWYAISIDPGVLGANNAYEGAFVVTPAANGDTVLADAPFADFPATGIKLGQVLVQEDGAGGILAIDFDNIVQVGVGAGGGGGGGGGAFDVVLVNSDVTLLDRTTHLVDTSALRTLTLPSPDLGVRIEVIDHTGTASTNNITIQRFAGENIEGAAADWIIEDDFSGITLIADGTNWKIF